MACTLSLADKSDPDQSSDEAVPSADELQTAGFRQSE